MQFVLRGAAQAVRRARGAAALQAAAAARALPRRRRRPRVPRHEAHTQGNAASRILRSLQNGYCCYGIMSLELAIWLFTVVPSELALIARYWPSAVSSPLCRGTLMCTFRSSASALKYFIEYLSAYFYLISSRL